MKRKTHIQDHPNQEDKSGKAMYASSSRLNSSTNPPHEHNVDMPEGAESDYKKELFKSKKKVSRTLPKTPKQ